MSKKKKTKKNVTITGTMAVIGLVADRIQFKHSYGCMENQKSH